VAVAFVALAAKASMPPTQKSVLISLCWFASDSGECFPSIEALMEWTCLCERVIQRSISQLEKDGFITRNIRPGRSTLYSINPRTTCTPVPHAPQHVVLDRGAPHAGEGAPHAPIKVTKKKKEKTSSLEPRPKTVGYTEDFEAFFAAYPKKINKVKAYDEWKKIDPDKIMLADILEGVDRYIESGKWNDKQFIPYPERFIKNRRWEDELDSGHNGSEPDWLAGCVN